MLKPWPTVTLAIGTALSPLLGQEVRLSAFEHQDTLFFNRGSIELSALGVHKVGQFVQAWDKSGRWVIGIPRNHGASEQVLRGRIRTIVSALIDHGVVGVQTITTEPVARNGFDPILIGTMKADPWAGVDPNDDQPMVTAPPKPVPVPLPPPTTEPSLPKAAPLGPVPWLALSGRMEVQSNQIETPSTATLDIRPYQILGLNVNVAPGAIELDLGFSKTAQNILAANEQTEPTNQLDVSSNATNYFSQFQFAMNFEPSRVPIQVSYQDETTATTAVLPKGTLLLDQGGTAWISIVEGVNFAYKTRIKTFAMDWLFRGKDPSSLGFDLGIHLDKVERPFSVIEYGSFSNGIIYASNYDSIGIHGKIKSNPWREGFHFDALEIKVGHAKGINLVDQYNILNMNVSNTAFNEFKVKFEPSYFEYLGKRGFLRITMPIEYSKNSFKSITMVNASGDGQEAGLFGTSLRYGLKIDLGLRY